MPYTILHSLLWLSGLLFGIVPFFMHHSYGEASPYLGEDNFGSHILIVLILAAIGSTIWGALSRWLSSGDFIQHKAKSWMLFTLIGLWTILPLAFFNILNDWSYLAAASALFTIVAVGASRISHHPTPTREELRKVWLWLTKPQSWNGPFFIALFALLVWHNVTLINAMHELAAVHKFSLILSRMCTQLALTGALYFLILLSIENGPRWSRPFIWAIISVAPIFILLDLMMHSFWNQTFLSFLNNLGTDGLVNFDRELRGGGVDLTILGVLGIASTVILLSCGITLLCSKLGKKWECAPVWISLITILGFTGATIEQAIGMNWKSRRHWMQEYQEFGLQLSPVRPVHGIAHFDVAFREHHWQSQHQSFNFKHNPDIYLVFIESLRQDALTPEITPFLYQFAQTESQPIGRTWTSSNGTHLSWFSTFTSRVATAREHSRDVARANNWPGLDVFHLFKNSGYDLQIHTAKNLEFRDMGCHFIGNENSPFSVVRECIEGDATYGLSYPEREVIVFDDLKQQINTQAAGGHFIISTIDSPHYKYSWHKDFDIPFPDYYPHAFFPSSPSLEDTRLIKNQYFNAIAWGDHLAKDFCQNLKDIGKYDDSIVIFMGDHGEEFQDHGGWLHVSSLENEQVQSPMLIKWPKSMGRGPEVAEASHLDLMPSLLDYLRAENTQLDTAGISLLKNSGPRTNISTTAQGGLTKEAMLLTREGFKAYFTWPQYYNGRPSSSVTLTRFVGPEGDILLDSPEDYANALQQFFPDAFSRFFTKFELNTNE
ncbi:sulfatase-like hydrolase/transferase [Rubritalea spongiae]|uniref:Sulfatase-like hydrolase/transferase n=1 Tax=Rubritalea spongiae TaxID=430797 RepID=A0ABW5DZZ4_9BACT